MKSKLTNFINKVTAKGKGYLLSLSLFYRGVLTNTAYADDPFAKTDALAQQGISKVQRDWSGYFGTCSCCDWFSLWFWWT